MVYVQYEDFVQIQLQHCRRYSHGATIEWFAIENYDANIKENSKMSEEIHKVQSNFGTRLATLQQDSCKTEQLFKQKTKDEKSLWHDCQCALAIDFEKVT